MQKRFGLFVVTIALFFSMPSFGKGQNSDRTVSVDSGYFAPLYSNHAFWNFGIEFDGAGSKLFDTLGASAGLDGNPLTRVALEVATYFGWRYPQYAFFVANHEFGHGTRGVAVGGSPNFLWDDGDTSTKNIFIFFGKGFLKYGKGAQTSSSYSHAAPANWEEVVSGAGVNNSTSYAEALEDEVQYQGGHIVQYIGYVNAKQDTASYVDATLPGETGDMQTMRDYYNSRGFGVSYAQMKQGSLVSRWLSATNWAYLWSSVQYARNGDPNVKPFYVGNFKAPDVSHFLTSKGLSYKVRSGFSDNDLYFPISIEYVYQGKKELEVELGYSKLFQVTSKRQGRYSVTGYLNSKAAVGGSAHADYPISNSLIASGGGSLYQTTTLIGERQASRLSSSATIGYEVWARVSAVY